MAQKLTLKRNYNPRHVMSNVMSEHFSFLLPKIYVTVYKYELVVAHIIERLCGLN